MIAQQKCIGLLVSVLSLLLCFRVMAGLSDSVQHLGAITGSKPVVLLKNRATGAIQAFRTGQAVFKLGTILEVSPEYVVILENTGKTSTVFSKLGGIIGSSKRGPPKVFESSEDKHIEEGFARIGNKIDVDKSYRDRMIKQELPNILMQAATEAVMENGQIKGFRIFQFEPNSIFSKLGMKDGDVVEEINGSPLNNVAKTIQFLNGLKDEGNVSVNVMRNGAPVTLELKVH